MVISDDTINKFLKNWTGSKVTAEQFAAAFRGASVTDTQFFDLMREELLVRQLKKMFLPSLNVMTPIQRWDYYNRLKRTATIEAIPVAVDVFVKQVEDPTDEELKTFFEENKETLPIPGSPAPDSESRRRSSWNTSRPTLISLPLPSRSRTPRFRSNMTRKRTTTTRCTRRL